MVSKDVAQHFLTFRRSYTFALPYTCKPCRSKNRIHPICYDLKAWSLKQCSLGDDLSQDSADDASYLQSGSYPSYSFFQQL